MPELRKDPVGGYWVILSPEQAPQLSRTESGRHDPLLQRPAAACPLCPGNEVDTPAEVYAHRPGHGAASHRDAPGWTLRVVPHKFPVLIIEGDMDRRGQGLYDRMSGTGAHELLVETADHTRQLKDLSEAEVEQVLWAYRHRILDLKRDLRFRYIAVFKAHGGKAGATLGHSHSQLVAMPIVPRAVVEQIEGAQRYFGYKERCLFCDIVRQEVEQRERIVYENGAFVVICPYAPRVPFEMWILPRHHRAAYEDGSAGEYALLAGALRVALRKLALALDDPCYSFVVHNAPFSDRPPPYFHWHIEILPALSRGAGVEWGSGCYVNPTPPEESAQYLRELRAEG